MKKISTRELRVKIGSLEARDLPMIVTNYGKPVFVLVDHFTFKDYLELSDYNVFEIDRQNKLFRKFLEFKGFSPDKILEDGAEVETPDPKKVGNKSESLEDFMEANGLKFASDL